MHEPSSSSPRTFDISQFSSIKRQNSKEENSVSRKNKRLIPISTYFKHNLLTNFVELLAIKRLRHHEHSKKSHAPVFPNPTHTLLFENREIDGNRNSRDQNGIEKTPHFPELRAQPSPADIWKINRRLRSKDVQPAAIIVIYGERRISGTSGENQGLGNARGWRLGTSSLPQRTDTRRSTYSTVRLATIQCYFPRACMHFFPKIFPISCPFAGESPRHRWSVEVQRVSRPTVRHHIFPNFVILG